MRKTTYQVPEIRDENDNIIQEGTFGKKSAFVNSTNSGAFDYIVNNLEALHSYALGSVVLFGSKDKFPTTGDSSKLYVADDTGKAYRWNGTAYDEMNTQEVPVSVTDAKQSATAAKTSETNSKASEIAAKASETNAANSASAAAKSAKVQQSDWGETDSSSIAYIKGKPTNLVTTDAVQTITGDKEFTGAVTMATGKITTVNATSVNADTINATDLTVTGSTSVPTANADNNSNTVANTAFVKTAIANLVNGAPSQLDTLHELSTALGNDANFSATVAKEIGEKLDKAGGTITGPILYDKTPNDDSELINKAYADKVAKAAEDKSATDADTKISTAHNYIKRDTAYKLGDILESPNLPHGYLIVVTQAGTTGSSEPDWTTIKNSLGGVVSDGTVQFYINDTLSKHALGDIVYKPLAKLTEHEYLLPLDGQTIDSTTYKRLADYLGTSTLPNLNGRYLRADTIPNTMVMAGLPNIKGWANVTFASNGKDGLDVDNHLFTSEWQQNFVQNGAGKLAGNLTFDAQKYNSIYGNSDTVTPLTYTVRAYICYA